MFSILEPTRSLVLGLKVQRGGHPRSLNGDQIASDTVHHRLKHRNAIESDDSKVEDESSHRADQHGDQNWNPTGEENLSDLFASVGKQRAHRDEENVEGDDGRSQPLVYT